MDAATTDDGVAEPTNRAQAAHRRVRVLRITMAAAWTATIMLLCWLPRGVVHEAEEGFSWFRVAHADKIVHGTVFLLFAILWVRVSESPRRLGWVALGGIVLAIVTELGQLVAIVGRDAGVDDALVDAAGLVVGLLVAPRLEPWLRRIESWLLREPSAQRLPVVQERVQR